MDGKSFAKNIFIYTIIAVISFFFVFIWNPFQLAVYSLLAALFIYIAKNIRQQGNLKLNGSNLKRYLPYAGLTYFLILVLYSVSPYLRLKEFQCVHQNYHIVQGEVTASAYDVYKQRGNLYSFVNVDYSYHANGIRYQGQQKEALKFYSFPIFSNTKADYLKGRVKDLFSQIQEQRSYVIMVDSRHPEDSRFFSGSEVFYWSGSILKNFFSGILFMITVIVLVGLIAFLFRNYKSPSPADRKSIVRKIWKILLIILGTFFIIYLLLVVYFKSTGKL